MAAFTDNLVRGEQQRVDVAQVFVRNHAALLLDEPTSLDGVNGEVVPELIEEAKARGCHRWYVSRSGRPQARVRQGGRCVLLRPKADSVMSGRLIGVAGPSGAGKDTLMRGLARADRKLSLVRRTITRTAGAEGEEFDSVTEEEFERRRQAGAFCLDWQAHGLLYGIPDSTRLRVRAGERLIANLSRGALADAAAAFPELTILHVVAAPDRLAARLAGRRRESSQEIAHRLSRAERRLPSGFPILTIQNDGSLEDAVSTALALLQPEST